MVTSRQVEMMSAAPREPLPEEYALLDDDVVGHGSGLRAEAGDLGAHVAAAEIAADARGGERHPHRPAGVAVRAHLRVLDVADQLSRRHLDAELDRRDPPDGRDHRLAEMDRAARNVPLPDARLDVAAGQYQPVGQLQQDLDGQPWHPRIDGVEIVTGQRMDDLALHRVTLHGHEVRPFGAACGVYGIRELRPVLALDRWP